MKHDNNVDNYDIAEYFQEIRREGAEQERAKIVAWLRDDRGMIGNALGFAHWIEAGEHLK